MREKRVTHLKTKRITSFAECLELVHQGDLCLQYVQCLGHGLGHLETGLLVVDQGLDCGSDLAAVHAQGLDELLGLRKDLDVFCTKLEQLSCSLRAYLGGGIEFFLELGINGMQCHRLGGLDVLRGRGRS